MLQVLKGNKKLVQAEKQQDNQRIKKKKPKKAKIIQAHESVEKEKLRSVQEETKLAHQENKASSSKRRN